MQENTVTIKDYRDIWKQIDPSMPFEQQLEFIKNAAESLADGQAKNADEQMKAQSLLVFIQYMEVTQRSLTCFNIMTKDEELQIRLSPFYVPYVNVEMENFIPGPEHLYLAKGIFSREELYWHYGDPQDNVLHVCRNKDGQKPAPKICGGCNVRGVYEHRCHEGHMKIQDEHVPGYCQCVHCAEKTILSSIGALKDPDWALIHMIKRLEEK